MNMTINEIANFVDDVQVQLVDIGQDEDTAAEIAAQIERDLLWVQSRVNQKAAGRQRSGRALQV